MKQNFKKLFWIFFGLAVLCAVFAQGNTPANSDAKQMQGTWRLIYQESQGKKLPDEQGAKMFHGQFVFTGEKAHYSVELPGFDFVFACTLDAKQNPKWIDLVLTDSSDKRGLGQKLLGIYRLSTDTLDICYGITNRPTDFSADAGSDNVLIRLKR